MTSARGGGGPKVAILFSGTGSNLKVLLEQARDGCLRDCCRIRLAASDNPDAPGLAVATAFGIPTRVVPARGRPRTEFERELAAHLDEQEIGVIVLAGFMRIFTPGFVGRFPRRIVNIHPADTRVYQGAHGYEEAWRLRWPSTRITVHFVDAGVDTGEIIAQAEVDLSGADSLDEIRRRGLAVEHALYAPTLAALFAAIRKGEPPCAAS